VEKYCVICDGSLSAWVSNRLFPFELFCFHCLTLMLIKHPFKSAIRDNEKWITEETNSLIEQYWKRSKLIKVTTTANVLFMILLYFRPFFDICLFSLLRVHHRTFICNSSHCSTSLPVILIANQHSQFNLHKIVTMNLHTNRKNANARRSMRVEKQFSFFCGFGNFYRKVQYQLNSQNSLQLLMLEMR
jgi:hypothetical protein